MKRLGLITMACLCAVASATGANGMDEKLAVDEQLISAPDSKVQTARFSAEPNNAPKTLGEATLGKFRTFKC